MMINSYMPESNQYFSWDVVRGTPAYISPIKKIVIPCYKFYKEMTQFQDSMHARNNQKHAVFPF